MEDKTGNLPRSSTLSKPILLSIAKDTGLEVEDGNPDIVDKMLELDCSRTAASELNCKFPSCSKDTSPGKETCSEIASSSNVIIISPNNCQDGNPDIHGSDQEQVRPR